MGGIPILLLPEAIDLPWIADELRQAEIPFASSPGMVDGYVQENIVHTCGSLYAGLTGRLTEYPIPDLRLARGTGQRFLDVGCNWGRWSIAARRAGYSVMGIDVSLQAIRAAMRVARQLGIDAEYVVGDARALPFADGYFDVAFSYSVLQHLPESSLSLLVAQVERTLTSGGVLLLQFANRNGVRSIYQRMRSALRPGSVFDVRYWSIAQLRRMFDSLGGVEISADGFFALNAQSSDRRMLRRRYRLVVSMSELLRRASERWPALVNVADSVYVRARKK